MTDLTLLHTAKVHCATFDRLAPQADLHHVVRPDWLARAQNGIDDRLAAEIAAAVKAAEAPVLCSCTTIGPVAEAAGAIRIDWPMMMQAALIGGPVLLAYCLDSTAQPSQALLRRAFGRSDPQLTCLQLAPHWPLFEAGQTASFNQALAADIEQALTQQRYGCVVLAQASMAGAAGMIQTDVPVLASPEIATQALLPAP
ncbi:hypothetical protein [Parasedimentitalea psychrophila]|uniref:Asp/Glu racemase n=1 Tax=Parasedimentitalea psychrophila TaxID=2997337 RepID=A0A9Y2L582_9RHOB|nr:hypothetical protein [Parasedimentitalea psychrophila]WIY27154.1 hypothetical protein QPJ95_09695 [Parasedimentitalea psychrophila]